MGATALSNNRTRKPEPTDLNRYRIDIEYDGTPFSGWQRQSNTPSVQGEIERALFDLTGSSVTINGAGRTDSGVHAIGQVAHFDLLREWQDAVLRDALNAHLRPHPITVLSASSASPGFDARFSATARHYRYRILARRSPSALDRLRVWHVPQPVDVEAMQREAGALTGRHDFTTFRAADCQAKSPVKTLDRLEVRSDGDAIEVSASARSFLHSQVRSMVGTLVKIGTGAWLPGRTAEVLAARNRAACGPLAPPHGLYLERVDYAAGIEVPK